MVYGDIERERQVSGEEEKTYCIGNSNDARGNLVL